jgi:IS1 family transposase
LWGFVFKKEKNLSPEDRLSEDIGDIWTFTGIMPETKLIFAHISGKRTKDNARKLIEMIRKRSDGAIPYFTSDGNSDYIDSILSVYGEINRDKGLVPPEILSYAQVVKTIEKGRCVDIDKKIIFGTRDLLEQKIAESVVSTSINTSFIERSNLTMRQQNKRIERKTQGFSKEKSYFDYQLSLSITYYNFCSPHSSLKYYIKDKTIFNTPAMESGLTDHVWSMKELLSFRLAGT